jgi:RNA polymerase sigma-70 factor (ECF subfamily)
MPDPSFHITQLNGLLDRMKAGDEAATEELLIRVGNRLERLTRKMLRSFPGVHRWEQTDDVLQNALMRLIRALREVRPDSVRDFFGLAAMQIRRELIDLARHHYGPHGLGAHHISHEAADGSPKPEFDPPARTDPAADLAKWSEFHQEVEKLPVAEREVVSLVFYHGWTQAEVADLLQVTVRTVQRRWQAAMLTLHSVLRDESLPGE